MFIGNIFCIVQIIIIANARKIVLSCRKKRRATEVLHNNHCLVRIPTANASYPHITPVVIPMG